MELAGKTIVLTGGSSGIGFELARQLSAKGAEVFSLDIKPPTTPQPGVVFISTDLTDSSQIKAAVAQISQPIDILINNAGVMRRGDVFESTEAEYDLLAAVLLKASWLMLKVCKDKFVARPVVLQVSSAHALRPAKDPGLYSLFKQASWALLENVQRDFPEYTVKLAFPGPVDTPLARFGLDAEAIAEKEKIMFKADAVAAEMVQLLESDDHTKLSFDNVSWNYIFS